MALFFGAKGAAVAAIQDQLTRAGFSTKGVDGVYGKDTENAAQAAYASLRIPGQSGRISEELIGALAAKVGPGQTALNATPPDASTSSTEISSTWGLDLSKPTSKVGLAVGALALLGFVFYPWKK